MKYIICLVLFICSIEKTDAQINLVLNPSFEQYDTCPDRWDEIKYCNHWMSLDSAWWPPDWAHDPTGVPDYCNVCADSFYTGYTSVPSNGDFYHYPRTGNGMVQVQMYWSTGDTGDAHDYLQGHLSQTLDTGQAYIVTFYTVLEDYVFGINHIGAYLDDGTIDTTHNYGTTQTQYTPQVFDTGIISDTFNWTKIQGVFIANGTERIITIGNFFDRFHTHTILLSDTTGTGPTGWWAWYLIDDVSVIDCNNQPDAGDDTLIYPGDSVFLGTNEILIPYTWYVLGSTTPIDSGGGFWAKPTVTTTYVVRQDNICGEGYKYDTVLVRVWPDTLVNATPIFNVSKVSVYPNPVSASVTVEGGNHCKFAIYNLIGQEVFSSLINSGKESFDISGVPNGVYFVHIVDGVTGFVVVRKILKE